MVDIDAKVRALVERGATRKDSRIRKAIKRGPCRGPEAGIAGFLEAEIQLLDGANKNKKGGPRWYG